MSEKSSYRYPGTLGGLLVGVIASAPTQAPEVTIPVGFAVGALVDVVRARSRRRLPRVRE